MHLAGSFAVRIFLDHEAHIASFVYRVSISALVLPDNDRRDNSLLALTGVYGLKTGIKAPSGVWRVKREAVKHVSEVLRPVVAMMEKHTDWRNPGNRLVVRQSEGKFLDIVVDHLSFFKLELSEPLPVHLLQSCFGV